MRRRPSSTAAAGFTLVEVLVSLLILGIVAALSWQGIDAIVRTREISAGRLEQQLRLQSVIAQWETDLAELQESQTVNAVDFDGADFTLTRRAANGLQVVVWSLRGDSLTRWSSPAVTQSNELVQWWLQAQQLLGNEPGQLRMLDGVADWQLYFWRGNAWSNAQSSGDVAPPPAGAASVPARVASVLPDGVRLLLEFAPGSGQPGTLTRDVKTRP